MNTEVNEDKIESNKSLDESNNKIELVEVLKEPPKPVFTCYICDLYATYDYYGTRPLDRHANLTKLSATSDQADQAVNKKSSATARAKKETIVLFEKAYVRDDPFSQMKALNYLILCANCSVCNKMVCVGAECSFFYYNRRFCLNCSEEYIDQERETSIEFPQELVNELMKTFSKHT